MKTDLCIITLVLLLAIARLDAEPITGKPLKNLKPTAEEKAQQQKDFKEIEALGLPERAVREFKNKNPKAKIKNLQSLGYFPNRETVAMTIFYNDGSDHIQDLAFHKKKDGWTIYWDLPWILD